MTNIIEQMYKEYRIEPKVVASYSFTCGYNKKEYEKDVVEYPPFTAEKQIELITFLGNVIGYIMLGEDIHYYTSYKELSLSEALAQVLIDRKDNFNNSKVREILEK